MDMAHISIRTVADSKLLVEARPSASRCGGTTTYTILTDIESDVNSLALKVLYPPGMN